MKSRSLRALLLAAPLALAASCNTTHTTHEHAPAAPVVEEYVPQAPANGLPEVRYYVTSDA